MDNYEQQVECGKRIVREQLTRMAAELNEPRLLGFDFASSDRDFDLDQVSLVDRGQFKIVVKIERDDLADMNADKAVRRRVVCDLESASKSYFGI